MKSFLCLWNLFFYVGICSFKEGLRTFFEGDPYVTYKVPKCVSDDWFWCLGPIRTCSNHFRHRWITLGSIFHCHTCEDSMSKWADLSVCKAFISNSLINGLQTLKSEHFDTESSQVWQWKIDPHNPTVSKMVWTCPNRSQTSKLIIGNTFWTSVSDMTTTFKKLPQPFPLKTFPRYFLNAFQWSFSQVPLNFLWGFLKLTTCQKVEFCSFNS